MNFKKWLEDTGQVDSAFLANTSAPDGFSKLKSKYMAGTSKEKYKSINPEKKFGFKHKYK